MNNSKTSGSESAAVHMRREGVVERELPGELILYDPERDHAILLNQVAAAVWDLCDGILAPEQIAEQISCNLAAPEDQAMDDVSATITKLAGEGLLVEK